MRENSFSRTENHIHKGILIVLAFVKLGQTRWVCVRWVEEARQRLGTLIKYVRGKVRKLSNF